MHCTVIVPAYNTARYLPECLDSLLAQTYHDFDILVVDDGSTDSTPDVVDHYLWKTGDTAGKINAIRIQNNKGVQHALALGIKHISYKPNSIVTIVDSDDRVFPCALAAAMPAFQDPGVGFAWSKFITSNNKPGWSGPVPSGHTLYSALMSNWWRAAHHKFFRLSTYLKTPGLQPEFDRSVDFELALLLASTHCKYVHIDKVTYWYRQGRAGSITSQGAQKQRNMVERIKKWTEQSMLKQAQPNSLNLQSSK